MRESRPVKLTLQAQLLPDGDQAKKLSATMRAFNAAAAMSAVILNMRMATGLGVGLLLALMGTKAAGSMLFGLKPNDPVTIAVAIAALGAAGALASYLPARRAAGQDPMAALRDE